MPTASLRLALLATALALPGVLMAQAPAPAASPAPSASAPPKGPTAPKASKSTAPAAPTTGAAGATPSAAATGTPPSGGGKRNKSSSNAQGSAAGATTGSAGSAPAKSARSKDASAPQKVVGMQRAFADLQTSAEFEAYRDKAQAVKSVAECKTLMEDTKKQLEPRAKAQNKPINVDIDKACATAKERKGLTS